MNTPSERINAIRARITDAEQKAQRQPGSVRLLAVSKTRPVEDIEQARHAGQIEFGENYLQDALPKIQALTGNGLIWHFIGPIQSNKTRAIAEHFDWVHSVDRLKIAQRLHEQRPDGLEPLNICLQVNISNDPNKSGLKAEQTLELAEQLGNLSRLKLRGLMAIPAASDDDAQQRQDFAALRTLAESLQQAGIEIDTLSMGMSNDMEAAIAEGATIVRIGTAIFGPRN
ncbi:MAG: YggS family pyridoxal phosphate-dependent enzyme [Gammaproteobacteria bacterium]|nr:YggS family pyridoxal phosphate-dependent enzyme [Gammaproteobacteria bacterium]MDH5777817.1 YggS family pyridoxal phosphate-dependent enzyme [Gammaproteobacteria bacterium]